VIQHERTAARSATPPPAPSGFVGDHPTSAHSGLSHHQVPAGTSRMAVLELMGFRAQSLSVRQIGRQGMQEEVARPVRQDAAVSKLVRMLGDIGFAPEPGADGAPIYLTGPCFRELDTGEPDVVEGAPRGITGCSCRARRAGQRHSSYPFRRARPMHHHADQSAPALLPPVRRPRKAAVNEVHRAPISWMG
jgi:hypothetical protein